MNQAMRIFTFQDNSVSESATGNALDSLKQISLSEGHFVWLSCTRTEFGQHQVEIQATLQRLCGVELVDLHVSDLLNQHLSSGYDFTSEYDLLIFRRLSAPNSAFGEPSQPAKIRRKSRRQALPILRRVDTSPIGFVVLDRLLLSVHPDDCILRDGFAQRLLLASGGMHNQVNQVTNNDARSTGARGVASNPADLMLRIINHAVDGFLLLRRELSQQLDNWQTELLSPNSRGANWHALLDARQTLHQLDETCEDQRAAIRAWIESLKTWSPDATLMNEHQRDLLQVRSRDVLEHIERVVGHVNQLEHNAETAVEIHFNAQSHRTNEVMRTLTVFTAVFLPLNLIAGIFGMNFEFIPFVHLANGFWLTMLAMFVVAVVLTAFFLRKRYLERD